ncbi:MAG: hypothetical protein K2H29_00020 [Oscillospiraceae bacterium]|nr:hypothetical protein [Oscillospiraceae bacterium]
MIKFGNENINLKHAPFLIKTEENNNNCIRFIISFACEGEKGSDTNAMGINRLGEILSKTTPIYPNKNEVYEILFEEYILYQTRNESYCSFDDYEIRQGNYFIIFEKSRLLDVLPVMTDCQILSDGIAYPGKWTHYGIYCQNHIIDVISHHEPTMKQVQQHDDKFI